MNIYIKTTIAVFIGILLGAGVIFGAYIVAKDHALLKEVVVFLNKSIEAQNAVKAK